MEFQNNLLVKMDKMLFFLHVSFSFFYTPLPELYKKKKAAFYKGHPNFSHTPPACSSPPLAPVTMSISLYKQSLVSQEIAWLL